MSTATIAVPHELFMKMAVPYITKSVIDAMVEQYEEYAWEPKPEPVLEKPPKRAKTTFAMPLRINVFCHAYDSFYEALQLIVEGFKAKQIAAQMSEDEGCLLLEVEDDESIMYISVLWRQPGIENRGIGGDIAYIKTPQLTLIAREIEIRHREVVYF